jgi:hypothetical protein
VRSALGAGRLRLARQLVTEVGLLFVIGTGAGLALPHVSLPVLVRQFSQGGAFFSDTPQIDVRLFAVMGVAPSVVRGTTDQRLPRRQAIGVSALPMPATRDGPLACRYGRVCSSCQRGWWWRAQRSVTVPSIMARAVPG